ncbi:MAG: hypothetical protein ACTSSO_06740 [Candidatus Hodarchaeales archaeon]
MLHSHHKNTILVRIPLLVILISFWVITLNTSNAASTTDWGDVVDVNYSLWRDEEHTIEVAGNIDRDLPYIYLSTGSTVPQNVLDIYPNAMATLILAFKEALIGLTENQQKDFKIDSADAYNDGDLYYRIILTKFWYDASDFTFTTEANTTQPNATQTIDTLFLIGVGVIIVVGIVFYTTVSGNQQRKRALSEESSSSSRRERSISEKKTKLKELRELAELHSPSVDVEEPTKPDVKFRRRR